MSFVNELTLWLIALAVILITLNELSERVGRKMREEQERRETALKHPAE